MSTLSTHVLDVVRGIPAAGMQVTLSRQAVRLGGGETDTDGRIRALGDELAPGSYRLVFDTGGYFAHTEVETFYPEVVIAFGITDERHYHVPLVLSPFAYSTYRGS
ncbi:hydroxyisourate hydrolase [Nocardia sp. CNY236]|uniref:hydroxyisourate hydrolase n=1 Tax=Nocardia sp. CNY236 TaxID=1169152 RepID=UPI00040CD328|nr:hydroxyisourate hydrolase [Nocardia sp. CNY236]